MEKTYQNRYRVNVAKSVKGVHAYDFTVELIDSTLEEVLEESRKGVAKLDEEYPPAS